MDHGVNGRYLTLDQALTLQWCEFDLENDLTLDQVPLVSFEMLYFIVCFYLFN